MCNEKALHDAVQHCPGFKARVWMVRLDGRLSRDLCLCARASSSTTAVSSLPLCVLGLLSLPVRVSE